MSNSTGPQPRFGISYLHNWLSQPVAGPEAQAERSLALAVLTQGAHTNSLTVFRYSQDEFRLSRKGRTATLTFQNFATQEQEFAAYTLQVEGKRGSLLKGVHERSFTPNRDLNVQLSQQSVISTASPAAMRVLGRTLQAKASQPQQREPALG